MEGIELANIIAEFVEKEYPKGNEDRGFAMVCLAQFLLSLDKPESKFKIVKK